MLNYPNLLLFCLIQLALIQQNVYCSDIINLNSLSVTAFEEITDKPQAVPSEPLVKSYAFDSIPDVLQSTPTVPTTNSEFSNSSSRANSLFYGIQYPVILILIFMMVIAFGSCLKFLRLKAHLITHHDMPSTTTHPMMPHIDRTLTATTLSNHHHVPWYINGDFNTNRYSCATMDSSASGGVGRVASIYSIQKTMNVNLDMPPSYEYVMRNKDESTISTPQTQIHIES